MTVTTKSDGEVLTSSDWNAINTTFTNNRIVLLKSTVSRATTSSTSYTTLHSYTISDTEANFDYIIAEFTGVANLSGRNGDANAYYGIWVDTTQKSGTEIITNEHTYSAGSSAINTVAKFQVYGKVILVAGTDYAKGTGFDLYIKAKVSYTSTDTPTAELHRSYVFGLNQEW